MLKDIEDELAALVGEVENDAQPIIDRANQVDSVIVTIAIFRLSYRLAKRGLARCVTWIRERRRADTIQIPDGSTRTDQSDRTD